MSGDDVEDEITIEEFREKLVREDLIGKRSSATRLEQLRAIERCAAIAGLRVDVSAISSREQADRVLYSLSLLVRRMR